ncbi:MAG: hypothetical protein IKF99_00090 [Oscillospiraceae bacterium]|nr:hypothetical protein [Oscillospiraceae bacterium]
MTFCVLVAIIALLDFILLMFSEIIAAVFKLFHRIKNRRHRFYEELDLFEDPDKRRIRK